MSQNVYGSVIHCRPCGNVEMDEACLC